jgi:hypothetical protein
MKWWDKLLIGIGFCLAAFAIARAVVQYRIESFIDQLCQNKIAQELMSPNGRAKVVAFTHDCGAAGYPHTIVAILSSSRRLSEHQPIDLEIVAAAWEGYDEVNLRWRDERTLLVEEFGGGEEESSAPFHERLKVETNGRTKILKISPIDGAEMDR